MVAPALLCGSLIGSLPVFTIVAFFAATVFRNTQLGEEPHAARLKHPTVEEAAPFLLFLFLLVIDVILKVTKERQAGLLSQERQEALEDARLCRADAKPLETPDTYAQAAKLQRRALMREKHAQQLDTLKTQRGNALLYRLLRLAHTGAALAFVAWSWGRAAIAAPPRLLWPMDDALALLPGKGGFSGAAAGAISAPAWTWICFAASARVAGLVQGFVPSLALY